MFNSPPSKPGNKQFLQEWMNGILASDEGVRAYELFERVSTNLPELARLRMTPQSPPHHAEAANVAGHVERMLTIILALAHGAELLDIEEFAREKDLVFEFRALEQSIRTHKDFFIAYALAHDLGKAETVRFSADPDKQGSAEGFAAGGDRLTILATEPERLRYDKLFRATGQVAEFFDSHGISVHYDGHDRVGAGAGLARAREAILQACGVSISSAKMLAELIRLHMEILRAFERGADAPAFTAFGAIALKAGLNKELFLDLAAGALLLDGVLGSLHYEQGKFSTDLAPILHFYRAERVAEPNRHAVREEIEHRQEKAIVKELLSQGGLDPDTVFALLKTPICPVRGTVMHQVYDLIRDPESGVDFGQVTNELRDRARKTQALFHERGIRFTL